MAVRSDPRYFNWALNGKLRNDIDPLMIGVGNFSKLQNLRYVQTGIEGISGMTKINSSAMDYTQIDNGFHFKKSQPAEEHVFVQTTSGSNSRLVKSDNTASIPSADTFTTFETLTDDNVVMFADAPDTAMIAMDGHVNNIWGGDEYRTARFINFADDDSFWYDYTEQVTNTLQDANNVATIHSQTGTADSYTKLLLHMDGTEGSTTFTDSSTSAQTVTAGADAHITTSGKVFGTGCGIFDGTGDILTVTDDADFHTAGSNFTIDTRIYFNASVANGLHIICGQYEDANNYWYWGVTTSTTAGVITATFAYYAKVASAVVANYTWADTLSVSTWYHVELCRTTTTMRFFRNGTQKTKTETVAIGATSLADFAGDFVIGGQNGASYWYGKMDEFRFSNGTARHSSTFVVPSTAYSGAGAMCYLASIRPLDGFKFYVKTANATASVMSVQEWNGSDWNELSITDNTSSGGKSLAVTGTVTFTSSGAKVKVIKGTAAYWYKIVWTALSSTTQIYYTTVNAPMQSIKDIWDGNLSTCMMLTKFKSGDDEFTDYSSNITGEYPYESTLAYTYADLAVEADTGAVYMGFLNRQMGLKFTFPDPANVNEEAGTNATVYYYNGDSFVTVGAIEDNTSTNGISMSTSGTITWQPPEIYNEFPCDKLFGEGSSTKQMSTPTLYWYKIMFDQAVDADTRCTGITGIPAPVEIPAHRFGITWQNRLWLFNDQSKNKNSGWCSGYNTNCVFNGSDSGKVLFGNSEEVVCAETMFSRYSGGIYDSLVVFKKNAIYILDGLSIKDYKIYTVANSTGCIAPMTLKKCDIGYEIAPGVAKHILIFMSARGIDLFDGNSPPVLISQDIGDYFDPKSSNYINLSVVGKFKAFIDERNMEYHLLIATGSSTSLNKELVYDITEKKWVDPIDRGTGKALNCGFAVTDPYGNKFIYGGTTDGYIERLEYGTTFDGNPIVYSFKTGDIPLGDSMAVWCELHRIKLIAKSMSTSTALVTMKVYLDGSDTGITIDTTDQTDSHRYYQAKFTTSQQATTFAIECTVTTTNESCGFKPYLLAGQYSVMREDF